MEKPRIARSGPAAPTAGSSPKGKIKGTRESFFNGAVVVLRTVGSSFSSSTTTTTTLWFWTSEMINSSSFMA
ncbi:hypothetical protein H6P81_000914 [Aristolochia fimbriata]|uniref:Photosystem II phosphoprotein n=1 Tax=Aristolochia fimbriata TaxID=158543 RepID=A0AAV7F9A2_ARIFI|nr:hypothetical protein H6P81_000914 [Aristolochia fimbriata]